LASPFWKGIIKTRGFFKSGIQYICNNGKWLSFWEDKWLDGQPLRVEFPCLYARSNRKNAAVCSMFRNGRWLIPQYVEGSTEYYERQRLLALLSNVSLSTNQDDIVWKWNADGVFTVKSCYNFINDGGIRCAFTRIIWKAKIPEKVKIFIWLATKNRILTTENLKKRGWVGRDSCSLCNEAEETNFHILITCPFTQSLWQKILPKLNISEPPTSVEDSWLGWREKKYFLSEIE
jgi:hypothetical protein